jgi:hypothetical protein
MVMVIVVVSGVSDFSWRRIAQEQRGAQMMLDIHCHHAHTAKQTAQVDATEQKKARFDCKSWRNRQNKRREHTEHHPQVRMGDGMCGGA